MARRWFSAQDVAIVAGTAVVIAGCAAIGSWMLQGREERLDDVERRNRSEGTGDVAFDRATRFARSLRGVPDQQRLELYAYYKQGTEGPCLRERPGPFDFEGTAKWTAWKGLGDMSSTVARREYISLVQSLAPEWTGEDDGGELIDAETPESGGGGGSGRHMSRPIQAEESTKDFMDGGEDAKALCDAVSREDVAAVKAALAQGADPNGKNENGESLLHLAADRGSLPIAQALIEAGADVNAQEPESLQTPLMYACVGNNVEVAELLIRSLSDPSICDSDGCDPLSELEDSTIEAKLRRLAESL